MPLPPLLCRPETTITQSMSFYDTDLVLWAEAQAQALGAAAAAAVSGLPIHWENVAEEIEAWARARAGHWPASSPAFSST